jgi:histidyl-tRNA synthetase
VNWCYEFPENRPTIYRLIDRRDKMQEAEWDAYASELGLSKRNIDSLKSLLVNHELWQKSDELIHFFQAIDALGIKDYVRYEPGIIRGLDYYTGTVYEAVELEGEFRRSILGGGRYDNLLKDVGGEPLPATGFAMGDVIISLILEKHKLLPAEYDETQCHILVTIFDDSLLNASLSFATELRLAGLNAISYPEATKLSKQLKFADRKKMKLVIILGAEEINKGIVSIKDLQTGLQHSIPRDGAIPAIQQMLASENPL